jgi:hypothetical protein
MLSIPSSQAPTLRSLAQSLVLCIYNMWQPCWPTKQGPLQDYRLWQLNTSASTMRSWQQWRSVESWLIIVQLGENCFIKWGCGLVVWHLLSIASSKHYWVEKVLGSIPSYSIFAPFATSTCCAGEACSFCFALIEHGGLCGEHVLSDSLTDCFGCHVSRDIM